jgi:RNA polymerase sigma factor (sigma-70 family)
MSTWTSQPRSSAEEVFEVEPVVVATAPETAITTTTDYRDAFESLFTVAFRVVWRMVREREEALDLAQEAMARAYVNWTQVRECDRPAAWVSRVAANLALDSLRRRKRRADREPTLVVIETADGVEAGAVDLARALKSIPRRQQEAVVLRYVADLDERTVADLLGLSVGSVKAYASRGLDQLRAALAPDGEGA